MAFALLIIGTILLVSTIRNTQDYLVKLIKIDFTGQGNFVYWVVAILIIGAVGYVQKLKPLSDGFLVLVLLVLFLKKGNPQGVGGGFFAQFTQALGTTGQSSTSTTISLPGITAPVGGATSTTNPTTGATTVSLPGFGG